MTEMIMENDYGDSVVDVTGLEPVTPSLPIWSVSRARIVSTTKPTITSWGRS